MFHIVGYSQSVLTGGTLQPINALSDPTVAVDGKYIGVPSRFPNLLFVAGLCTGNEINRAQVQSPSLREFIYPEVSPLALGATFGNLVSFPVWNTEPIPLAAHEDLEFYSDGGGDGTTAQQVMGVVAFCDGKQPTAGGEIFTVSAKSNLTLNAGYWANTPITFDQILPVGKYQIVGMRAEGAGLVAARLVFIGDSAVSRPGCLGVASANAQEHPIFRMGNLGVWGTFDSQTPPSVDLVGATGTSQTYYFDLIRIG